MALLKAWMIPLVLLSASLILGVQAVDPVGDLLESTPPVFDLVGYSASFGPGTLTVTLTFDSVDPADWDWLYGWVDFDTDQNPDTGGPSHLETWDVEPFPSFGTDYYLEFRPFEGLADLRWTSEGWDTLVDSYPVTFDGASATVVLPRCQTSPDDGICVGARFDTVILLAGVMTQEMTERAPNDASVIRAEPEQGDLDEDGDVDGDDAAILGSCLTGSQGGPVAGACAAADLDKDQDVDQTDFGLLQRLMTGPF